MQPARSGTAPPKAIPDFDDIARDVRAVAGLNQSVLAALSSKCAAVQSAVAAELTRVAAEYGVLAEKVSPATNRLLTAKQIAEHLVVKESLGDVEARANRIPKRMVGRYVRFDLADVQRAPEASLVSLTLTASHAIRDVSTYAAYRSDESKRTTGNQKAARWSQRQIAEAVGVTANSVARWERGEMAIAEPAARVLRIIAAQNKGKGRNEQMANPRHPQTVGGRHPSPHRIGIARASKPRSRPKRH